ncbi:MAG: hypothetical protein EBT82_03085 [Micrococcales bacterium]|nr:hypothetical protein [Micrococcales bacterium]
MAKVYVSADSLHVELSFWETIGSFSRGFVIPLGDILTVEKSDKQFHMYLLMGTTAKTNNGFSQYGRSRRKQSS